ncbi:MAG: AarF/ABC1/UbiB kinase family protein [Chloroflexi bacterium]|nr:AarF/ABC1/UbiB kinase family protein [Chloroflexota bacterium]
MKTTRYWRILLFFANVILRLAWWELLLARLGFGRLAKRNRPARLRNIARAYHDLAVRMGGVLIKLGQFLSARADVLPPEITDELSGLQDEVPAEDFERIRAQAEAELGAPLAVRYADFDPAPLAAASLGQVHRARLVAAPDAGLNKSLDVVVKIQRPGIEGILATDLAALATVSRWLMRYRPIRRRVNVPALLGELARTLYEEIDYLAEGRNAETFAANFRERPEIRVPRVLWSHTTQRVLTLEDVFAIKINDYAAIDAAGIDRAAVAGRVFDIYMQQIFEDGFFHADPHPGNLFIQPLPPTESDPHPWTLTLVDFGMVGHVQPGAREGLREIAIGIARRDHDRLVKGYQTLNVLLPGADLELLKKAEDKVFNVFWGKSMDELRQIGFEEMHTLAVEFRELLFDMPFQVPKDLIFLFKTVATLSGLCTGLAPTFNFWDHLAPYAKKLLATEAGGDFNYWLGQIGDYAKVLVALPGQAARVLAQAERGDLEVNVPEVARQLGRLERALRRVATALVFLGLLFSGVQLYSNRETEFAAVLLGGALLALVVLIFPRPHRN